MTDPRSILVRLSVPQAEAAAQAIGFALRTDPATAFAGASSYQAARRAHLALRQAVDDPDAALTVADHVTARR